MTKPPGSIKVVDGIWLTVKPHIPDDAWMPAAQSLLASLRSMNFDTTGSELEKLAHGAGIEIGVQVDL